MTTVNEFGLVPPTPPRTTPRPRAARPATLDGRSVALVDSMLNQRGGWGRGILDAVEGRLREQWPRVRTEQVARPQLGLHEPERWARAMARRYEAIVIAVGD